MKRIVGLDVARSWAMVLALSAHAVVQVGAALPTLPELVLRTSTPIFMLLFGAMIAVAHIPRAERLGKPASVEANWTRAIQCYLLFLLNVAALVLARGYGPKYALLCAAMLGTTPYAAILKYYTIMFAAMPLIIALLRRVPVEWCFVGACAVHLAFPLVKAIPNPPPIMGQPVLERVATFAIGTGVSNELAGPSLLHSLALVFGGVWLGRWLRGRGSALWPLIAAFAAMALLSFVYTGYGPVDLDGLGSMRLRNLDHPAYVFLTGGVSLLTILVLYRFCRAASDWALVLGRRSLFAFGFGNVVVVLWPISLSQRIGVAGSALLLLCAVAAMVFVYDRVARSSGNGPGRAIRAAANATAAGTARFAVMLARVERRRRPKV